MIEEELFSLEPNSAPDYYTQLTKQTFIGEVLTPRNFLIYVLVKESTQLFLLTDDANEMDTVLNMEPDDSVFSTSETPVNDSEQPDFTQAHLQAYLILWKLLTDESADLIENMRCLAAEFPSLIQNVFEKVTSFTSDDVVLDYVDYEKLQKLFAMSDPDGSFSISSTSAAGLFLRKFSLTMQMLSLDNSMDVAQCLIDYCRKLMPFFYESGDESKLPKPKTSDVLSESQAAQFAYNVAHQLSHNAQLSSSLAQLEEKLALYADQYPHVSQLHFARYMLSIRTRNVTQANLHLRRYFEWHNLTLQTTGYMNHQVSTTNPSATNASANIRSASNTNIGKPNDSALASLGEEMVNHLHTHTAYRQMLSAALWHDFGYEDKARQLEEKAMEQATLSQSGVAYEHIASLRTSLREQDMRALLSHSVAQSYSAKTIPEISFSNWRSSLWAKMVQGDSLKEILQLTVRMFSAVTNNHMLLLLIHDLGRIWSLLGFKHLSITIMLCVVNMAAMKRVSEREEFVVSSVVDIIHYKANAGYYNLANELLDDAEKVYYRWSDSMTIQQTRLEMQFDEYLLRQDYDGVERIIDSLNIFHPLEAKLRRVVYEKELGDITSAVKHCEELIDSIASHSLFKDPTASGGDFRDLLSIEREIRARLLLMECELMLRSNDKECIVTLPHQFDDNFSIIFQLSHRHHLFAHYSLCHMFQLLWEVRSCIPTACALHDKGESMNLQQLLQSTSPRHFYFGFLLGKYFCRHLRGRWNLFLSKLMVQVEVLSSSSFPEHRVKRILRQLKVSQKLLEHEEISDSKRLFECVFIIGALSERLGFEEELSKVVKILQAHIDHHLPVCFSKCLNSAI